MNSVPEISLISIAQLSEMVREEADLTPEELKQLPIATKLIVSRDITWEVGKGTPGNDSLYVFALFHGDADHDVKAYVLPREAKPQDEHHWFRYTLNRAVPTLLIEAMTRATFLSSVAADLFALAVAEGVVDDPDDDEEPEEEPGATVHTLPGSKPPEPSVVS